jgi:hypothetical protein
LAGRRWGGGRGAAEVWGWGRGAWTPQHPSPKTPRQPPRNAPPEHTPSNTPHKHAPPEHTPSHYPLDTHPHNTPLQTPFHKTHPQSTHATPPPPTPPTRPNPLNTPTRNAFPNPPQHLHRRRHQAAGGRVRRPPGRAVRRDRRAHRGRARVRRVRRRARRAGGVGHPRPDGPARQKRGLCHGPRVPGEPRGSGAEELHACQGGAGVQRGGGAGGAGGPGAPELRAAGGGARRALVCMCGRACVHARGLRARNAAQPDATRPPTSCPSSPKPPTFHPLPPSRLRTPWSSAPRAPPR